MCPGDGRVTSGCVNGAATLSPVMRYAAGIGRAGLRAGRALVDLVLPPRCAGCAMIVASDSGFCPDCWQRLDFLTGPACARCDTPFEQAQGEGAYCGACIADPPPYVRVRVPLAYGPLPRRVVLRLKYGRRLGFARLMARLMLTVLPDGDQRSGDPWLLVPVPLHRWRLWTRGFNQSVEVARHLARSTGLPLAAEALVRRKPTPPLRGLGRRARARTVRGAFAVPAAQRDVIAGQAILLVDDVFTSGATTAACARALLGAGALRVEVAAFARVIAHESGWADIDFAPTAADI